MKLYQYIDRDKSCESIQRFKRKKNCFDIGNRVLFPKSLIESANELREDSKRRSSWWLRALRAFSVVKWQATDTNQKAINFQFSSFVLSRTKTR